MRTDCSTRRTGQLWHNSLTQSGMSRATQGAVQRLRSERLAQRPGPCEGQSKRFGRRGRRLPSGTAATTVIEPTRHRSGLISFLLLPPPPSTRGSRKALSLSAHLGTQGPGTPSRTGNQGAGAPTRQAGIDCKQALAPASWRRASGSPVRAVWGHLQALAHQAGAGHHLQGSSPGEEAQVGAIHDPAILVVEPTEQELGSRHGVSDVRKRDDQPRIRGAHGDQPLQLRPRIGAVLEDMARTIMWNLPSRKSMDS